MTASPFTSDADIAAVGTGLLARTLPRACRTHAGHFAAAFYLLAARPDLDAETTLRTAIRAYNESVGTANTAASGYHETITLASLHVARLFLETGNDTPIVAVCNALLASPYGKSDWVTTYWSRSRIFSPEARFAWVAPDIAALPARGG